MPSNTENFKKFPNETFIETGSFYGEGIQQAIESGFEKIISIELSPKYFSICVNRFNLDPNVKIVFGDSYKILPEILPKINSRITFWLDGHHSCEDTALGDFWAPLMQELDAIKSHHIKNHTILIDDMRCWNEYDSKHGFETKDLLSKLYDINPNYKIEYLNGVIDNDILVAYIE
jgi:hypothetical protein